MNIITNQFNYNSSSNLFTVGMEQPWDSDIAPMGWMFKHGQLVLRKDFQMLLHWAKINNLIVTDEDWFTNKKYALFSYGDGHTNFRLPDKRGFYDVGYEQGYHSGLSIYQQDQFQAHKHTATFLWWDYPGFVEEGRGAPDYGNHRQRATDTIIADGENGEPRTGTRTQPRSLPRNYIVKY